MEDFLKILKTYELKKVSRMSSNSYICEKTNNKVIRKETVAEHIYSSLKLANYFFSKYSDFLNIDKLKVYELLMYHDDIEIEVGDVSISQREKRKKKEEEEKNSITLFASKYPKVLGENFKKLDLEYRRNISEEAKFAHAIDKLDALVHELQYPEDWGIKTNFTEENIRKWFQSTFEYNYIFLNYFEDIIKYLNKKNYFEE